MVDRILLRLTAVLLVCPATAVAQLMACHVEHAGPGAVSCFLPMVNATYACAVRGERLTCTDARYRPIDCRHGPLGFGDVPQISCDPGGPAEHGNDRITISGDRPFTAQPVARNLAPSPRPRARSASSEESALRSIPSIADLLRPPAPDPVQSAVAAIEESNAAAIETANAAAVAAQAAAAQAAAAQVEAERRARFEQLSRPTWRYSPGYHCYRSGSSVYCDPR